MDLIIIFTMGLALATLIIASEMMSRLKSIVSQQRKSLYLLTRLVIDCFAKNRDTFIRSECYEEADRLTLIIAELKRDADKLYDKISDGDK